MKKRISVIIPVYNVETYLLQCVNSVLMQTYKAIEIILVDDGSCDRSTSLSDELLSDEQCILVVHKANGGAASARNNGLAIASGEYIIFLDGDDFWCNEYALSELSKRLKPETDIVCFGYQEYIEGTGKNGVGINFNNFSKDYSTQNDLLREMIAKGVYVSSPWCKLIKNALLRKSNLFFCEGVTAEDIDWSARLLRASSVVEVYCDSFYCYRQHKDSIVHNIKFDNLKSLANSIVNCISIGKDIQSPELCELYYNYVAYQYITFLKVALLCEDDPRTKSLVKEMKSYKWLLNYHLNRKVKIVYLFNKFLGFKLMHKCLKIYSK